MYLKERQYFKEIFPPLPAFRIRRRGAEVLYDVLKACENGTKKTHIMYRSNVNPAVLNRYLNFCADNGLITKNKRIYTTTAKGLEYIRCLNELSSLKRGVAELQAEAQSML
jgi:predicted transcriptional regulator